MTRTTGLLRVSWIDAFLAALAAIACVFWAQGQSFSFPYNAYPMLVAGAVVALSILCLVQARFKSLSPKSKTDRFSIRKLALIVGIGLYIVCIPHVGYFVSTYAYLVAMLQLERFGKSDEFLETKPLAMDSVVALGVTSAIAFVFKYSLDLIFPHAWLF